MSAGNSLEIQNLIQTESQMASEISNRWSEWNSARRPWLNRVNETRNYVFATSTKDTTNKSNPWSHTTHHGKLCQIYDNLKANYHPGLMPNRDWLRFEGEDEEAVLMEKRANIESYIKTKHRLDNFHTTVGTLLDDWILTGNCFAAVTFVVEKSLDPDTELDTLGYVGPRTTRISPNDIVFNPLASTFDKAPKIIRSIKTLGEVSRDIEENPEMQYEAAIFQRALDARSGLSQYSVEDVDKNTNLQIDGFGTYGQYLKTGFVELLDFYGDIYDLETSTWLRNRVITVVDRQFVIRNQELANWTGRPHIHHVSWRARPDNLWGMGPLDNLVGMQYRINHLENARADAFDLMISPDYVYQGDVQEYDGPNGSKIYEAPEGGDVRTLAPDTTILNADFQIRALEDKMELYAGAPREAMGMRTPGEKTAFEVQSLQNAAGRIFQSKMNLFEINMLEKIVNSEVEVARRNLNTADVIRVTDDDTGIQSFISITKEDLLANGKLIPVGARHFARQAQLVQELAQFQQLALADPQIAQHFPTKRLAKVWEGQLGFDKFNLYKPYGRIEEQMESQRLMNTAQEQLQVEQETPLEEEESGL